MSAENKYCRGWTTTDRRWPTSQARAMTWLQVGKVSQEFIQVMFISASLHIVRLQVKIKPTLVEYNTAPCFEVWFSLAKTLIVLYFTIDKNFH